MAEKHVLTPGGYRPQSRVHLIERGSLLDGSGGRHRKLDAKGNLLADHGAIPVAAGIAPLMPANVMTLRKALKLNAGRIRDFAAAAPLPALGSGWIVFSSWTNRTGQPVTLFSTSWVVPPAPSTQSGQTIFIFNGIQNSTMIYQPVLQWGISAAGGGSYWAVASWYAGDTSGHSFHSQLAPVEEGATLAGVMALTGQSNGLFSYSCQFQGNADTVLPIQNVRELTWCVETLEAYGINRASDYPATGKTALTGIEIKVGPAEATLDWAITNAVTDTGQHAVVVSGASPGGEIDLHYADAS